MYQQHASFAGTLRSWRRLSLVAAIAFVTAHHVRADEADTFHLTDDPGNWFRSDATGGPVTIIDAGDEVDFRINNCCTNTRHTVTLLVKPPGSAVQMDQD